MNDNTLRQNIIDELEFDPSIDSANIGVAVDDGIVTLAGHVVTYGQKAAAEDIVRRLKGVRGIAQELEVRLAGSNPTADDEIVKRVLDTIRWSTVIPDGALVVKVEGGWVTLTGLVEWNYQKTAVTDAIKDLEGVVGISNLLQVKAHTSGDNVSQRIEEALKRYAEIEAKAIKVAVHDGKVTLEGKVKAWSELRAVERAAWSVPGVTSVEDNIKIVSW